MKEHNYMQAVKVNGLTYNWDTYKTLNFKEIHGLNFDNNEIEVLEIKGTDFDFHVVIRIDTSCYVTRPSYSDDPNWLQRTPDWPENYYLYYRFLMSVLVLGTKFSKKNRFKPYITNSSGTAILRKASENEVIEISP